MLDEMDAPQFVEWIAFEHIQSEDRKRAELADKAVSGVQNYRRQR